MPCSDSSSSMVVHFDHDEKFIKFEYAKITCSSEIKGGTGLSDYLIGKNLNEILKIPYEKIIQDLQILEEEAQFVMYMELDALKSAIAEYLGSDDEFIDRGRCKITSVDYLENEVEVALVVLPPKDLPKILPCSLAERKENN